ncbi:hypothetical protein [Saccharopolyspora shandongensis]|uniref:hypothetical protein n=1 Tax=Saccharopolyspora shandongensis TaxID=418495 RepID=UPI003405A35E
MAKLVLKDARLVAGGADLSCNANTVTIEMEVEEQEATSFCSGGYAEVIGGLKSVTIEAGGQWEAGDPGAIDDAAWARINGSAPVPWLAAPVELAVGGVAYSVGAVDTSYSLLGEVGSVAPWEAEAAGSGAMLRGAVEIAPTAVTASGTSTGRTVTTAAGQTVRVAVHVLAVSAGASLTVAVERDADLSFASPDTVATSQTYTAPGGEVLAVTPNADTAYRVSYTLTGATPSAQFVAVIGAA